MTTFRFSIWMASTRLTDACSHPDERIGFSIPHTGCSSEVLYMSERPTDVCLAEIISEPFHANTTQYSLSKKPVQLFILWDFVHFSGCGILSCGILSCGILSVGILSCGILSCGILSGYHAAVLCLLFTGPGDAIATFLYSVTKTCQVLRLTPPPPALDLRLTRINAKLSA